MEEKISSSKNLPMVRLESKAVLKITKEFNHFVNYLCKKINNIEWSGVLFFESEGEINTSEGVIITPIDIYPMDMGSSAYTEYDFSEEVFDYYEKHPERFGMKYGHIHSHHSMGAFFSGTDSQELIDNCVNHSYYISVIVNNNEDIVAKIAIPGKRKIVSNSAYMFSGLLGSIINISRKNDNEEDVMYYVDMVVERDFEKDFENELFYSRVNQIIEKHNKPKFTEYQTALNFPTKYEPYKRNIVIPENINKRSYPIPELFTSLLGRTNNETVPELFDNILSTEGTKEELEYYLEQCFDTDFVTEEMEKYQRNYYDHPDDEDVVYVLQKLKGMAVFYRNNSQYKIITNIIIEIIDKGLEELKEFINEKSSI